MHVEERQLHTFRRESLREDIAWKVGEYWKYGILENMGWGTEMMWILLTFQVLVVALVAVVVAVILAVAAVVFALVVVVVVVVVVGAGVAQAV
jgi:hypothetical protein